MLLFGTTTRLLRRHGFVAGSWTRPLDDTWVFRRFEKHAQACETSTVPGTYGDFETSAVAASDHSPLRFRTFQQASRMRWMGCGHEGAGNVLFLSCLFMPFGICVFPEDGLFA
jgi:hypothetical protein